MIDKYFKQFSIKQLIFWIGGIVIGAILFTVLTLVGLYTNESLEVDVSARNAMLSQRIVLLSNIYVNTGDQNALQDLESALNLYDGSLLVMKHGGTVPEMESKKIRPASDRVDDYIERIEEVWKPFRSNIRTILEEPLKTSNYSFNMNIDLELAKSDSIGLLTHFEQENATVRNSLSYLEKNSGTMLKVNQDLVKAYVNDSEEVEYQLIRFILIAIFLICVVVILISILLNRLIISPLQELSAKSNDIANGNLEVEFNDNGTMEMSRMRQSLISMRKKLQDISVYVMEFSKGNYEVEFENINEDQYKDDPFIHSLMDTKKRLQQNSEERSEREWVNEGSANLNKLIRIHSNDAKELGRALVKELARFMDCSHAAFYIHKKDPITQDEFMELAALYAFDTFKEFDEKKVKLGEGLIGEIWQEAQPIYLTEIPENYITIRSGLGDAPPNSLTIYPFKSHGEVEVIIELASFNPLQSKSLQLLNEIGGAIATSVVTSENTSNVSKLYNDSKRLTDELRTNEEEMKQNMEELQATQEQLVRERRETESSKKLLNEIVDITGGRLIIVEANGNIWFGSQSFLEYFDYQVEDIKQKPVGELIPDFNDNTDWQVSHAIENHLIVNSKGASLNLKIETKQLYFEEEDKWIITLK
ncbi:MULTISPECIES: GAF domain-containing protein [Flammeovirga]|uniref:GAF domain-containing protein n=1 Tax=Flammeovirga agarivorans TaxID=2726742 RepID=A0A7X8XXK6_9BACT|nr:MULTISPECIES: GAF domain-containing protein [Flammeovirga]NLR93185.1 GAF domain-containing protein [Flammeovirga agarivorans]